MLTTKTARRIEVGDGAWVEIRPLSAAQYLNWQKARIVEKDSGMRALMRAAVVAVGGFERENGEKVELKGAPAANFILDELMVEFVDKLSTLILDDSAITEEEKKRYASFFSLPTKSAKAAELEKNA